MYMVYGQYLVPVLIDMAGFNSVEALFFHMWQSRIEIEYYSGPVKIELYQLNSPSGHSLEVVYFSAL